jgi:hypothetical protein
MEPFTKSLRCKLRIQTIPALQHALTPTRTALDGVIPRFAHEVRVVLQQVR